MFGRSIFWVLLAGFCWSLRAERFGFGGFWCAASNAASPSCLFAAFLDRL
jgi:hypothetical protein